MAVPGWLLLSLHRRHRWIRLHLAESAARAIFPDRLRLVFGHRECKSSAQLMSRRKSITFACIFLLIGLIASSVIAEATLRLFTPAWLEYRMRVLEADSRRPRFGGDGEWSVEEREGKFVRFEPHTTFSLQHLEYNITSTIDAYGGRDVPARMELPPGDRQLLPVLGDSFTFGVGVDDEETYVNILAQNLGLRLVNLGVPGSGLHEQLDIVEMRHDELGRPERYVFAFYFGNDFADLLRSRRRFSNLAHREPPRQESWLSGTLVAINSFVNERAFLRQLYVLQLIKTAGLRLLDRDNVPLATSIFRIFEGEKEYIAKITAALRKEVQRLARFAADKNFAAVFVLIPDRYLVEDNERAHLSSYYGIEIPADALSRPYEVVTAELEAAGIPFIDATACLRESADGGLYYVHDEHLTARGHAILATCISPELERIGLRRRGAMDREDIR
jgi:hypothetical protein